MFKGKSLTDFININKINIGKKMVEIHLIIGK